jgi:hypothetical protein
MNINGCRSIIDGHSICPKLLPETAQKMIEEFKDKGIVAKILHKDAFKWRVVQGGQENEHGLDAVGLTEQEKAL